MDTNLSITDELIAEEKELESQASALGIERYLRKVDHAEERTVFTPELKRLRMEIPLLAQAIVKALAKPGPMAAKKREMFQGIHPYELALMTIRHCFNHYKGNQTVQSMATKLMDDIRIHKDDLRFKDDFPAYRAVIMRNLKSDHQGYRHKVLTHSRHKMGIMDTKWTKHEKILLGTFLLDLYCATCGGFEKADFLKPTKRWDAKLKRAVSVWGTTIRPTDKTMEWLDRNHEFCSKLTPVLMPMVVPPKDWVDPWNGGYISVSRQHNSSCRFIRRVSNKWLKENMDDIDPQVYEAVNRVQSTPYRINKKVLDVMTKLSGSGLAGLPDGKDIKLRLPPQLSPEQAKDKDKLRKWKIQAAGIYTAYFKEVAQKTAHAERMRMAHRMASKDAIWFPMNLDWRGRLFPMSSPFVSPQGDDPSKGLLEFAEGKEITAEGFIEFCIHGANAYGEDKLPEMGRVKWVEDHHDLIMMVADDPFGEAQMAFWTNAGPGYADPIAVQLGSGEVVEFNFGASVDGPWQFLAFCFDYAAYMRDRSHKSHLICAIDATCSGLQHWSAILADEKGAGRVGMIPKATPDDIYQAVADRVEERIKHNNDPIAVAWRGKVTRTITKRNVMTKLYGATMPGMRDQVKVELEKLDKKQGSRYLKDCPVDNFKAAQFISGENDAAMRDIITKATEGMDFVQGVARQLAKAGCPTSWKSPIGLPIDQTYWQTKSTMVQTYWLSVKVPTKNSKAEQKRNGGKRIRLMVSHNAPEKGIQERKAANSIAPNFIHSMDASHLMFISLGWNKAFTPVHDSFGTHASDLAELGKVVRETFIKMYDGRDYLDEFLAGVIRRYPHVDHELFLPDRGQFNFNNIKEATYFCR